MLHRFGRIQKIAVAAEAAGHLQTERHSVLVDAARQRDCRICDERDEIGQRKPVVVVAQRHPFERFEIKLRPGERRDRRGRRQHQVIVAENGLEAPENSRLLAVRPGHVGERHTGTHLVIGAHIGAERARVLS